ncbi:MAG: hypothetical protein K2V38_20140 [Gemmataceae bacterium]|nr:hypothetical protein [Gemmataceae bacterium]
MSTFVLGSTRSGKTSSTGRALMQAWLDPPKKKRWFGKAQPIREPPGMIALTVKVNEAENIANTAHLAGRGLDVIGVTEGGEWTGDPLAAYFALPGSSPAAAAKLLAELSQVISKTAGQSKEPFWDRSRERNLYYALTIVKAALGTVTFDDLYAFVTSLPYGPADLVEGGGYWKSPARVAARLAGEKPDPQGDIRRALHWQCTEWPATQEKLRESYRQEMLSVIFPMTQSPIAELLKGDSLHAGLAAAGHIVILDLPVLRYGAAGTLFQGLWGCVFDIANVQRNRHARVVLKWADEVQWLLMPEWSTKIATVCSESNYYHVYMSQTLPTIWAALNGSKDQVASLLSNSPLKVVHWTDCVETGEYVQKMLGMRKELMFGGGGSTGGYDVVDDLMGQHKPMANVSFSTQYQPVFRGEELRRFRRGGKECGFVCDALLTLAGAQPRIVTVPQTLI